VSGVTPSSGHGDAGGGGVTHLYENPAVSVSVERQAHQVRNRFKDQSAKFSGKTKQLWDNYTTHYDLVTRDVGVSAQHKLQFLHNLHSRSKTALLLAPNVGAKQAGVDPFGHICGA